MKQKKDEPPHSGFECPVYGILIPKDYKCEKDENGLLYFIPPEGAVVPDELKYCCRTERKDDKDGKVF